VVRYGYFTKGFPGKEKKRKIEGKPPSGGGEEGKGWHKCPSTKAYKRRGGNGDRLPGRGGKKT